MMALADMPEPQRPMTLAEAVSQLMFVMQAEGLSPATIRDWRGVLGRLVTFAERHGKTYVTDLTPALVRAAAADLMTPGPHRPANWRGGEGSATQLIRAVKGLCRRAPALGITLPDFSAVRPPKLPQRVQPRLTGEEFVALERAILSRIGQRRAPHFLIARDLATLYLLADTGLRGAEFCALDVEDLDLEHGTLTVRRGKGGKDRVLSIADSDPRELDGGPTLRALRTYLLQRQQAGYGDQDALWLTREGRRLKPKTLRQVLTGICEQAGLNGNRPPHAFRRGWFTENYQAEPLSLPVLVARMGWSSVSSPMVRTYTRGADLELARTHPRPSLAKTWRGGERGDEPPSEPRGSAQLDPAAIATAIAGDPVLRKTLIEALLRPAVG